MIAETLIALPLPDGRWLALTTAELQAGLSRAQATFGPPGASAAPAPPAVAERWLTSRELAALTGVGDTTLEGLAKRGVIPSLRIGKALRFCPSEVVAALRARQEDSRR